MLPVWIVYASNFDLNIPECHITDSLLSLYIFDSLGAQYHDMKLSLYQYIDIYHRSLLMCVPSMCLCAYVCLCMRVCIRVCVCTYVCVYLRTCEFKYPIEYVKIYRSSGTFDTHSSMAIFDEHLVW